MLVIDENNEYLGEENIHEKKKMERRRSSYMLNVTGVTQKTTKFLKKSWYWLTLSILFLFFVILYFLLLVYSSINMYDLSFTKNIGCSISTIVPGQSCKSKVPMHCLNLILIMLLFSVCGIFMFAALFGLSVTIGLNIFTKSRNINENEKGMSPRRRSQGISEEGTSISPRRRTGGSDLDTLQNKKRSSNVLEKNQSTLNTSSTAVSNNDAGQYGFVNLRTHISSNENEGKLLSKNAYVCRPFKYCGCLFNSKLCKCLDSNQSEYSIHIDPSFNTNCLKSCFAILAKCCTFPWAVLFLAGTIAIIARTTPNNFSYESGVCKLKVEDNSTSSPTTPEELKKLNKSSVLVCWIIILSSWIIMVFFFVFSVTRTAISKWKNKKQYRKSNFLGL